MLGQPPCSPNLTSHYFILFSKLKRFIKSMCFRDMDNTKKAIATTLKDPGKIIRVHASMAENYGRSGLGSMCDYFEEEIWFWDKSCDISRLSKYQTL